MLGVALPINLVFFVAIGLLFLVSLQYGAELTRTEEKMRALAEKSAFHEQRIQALEARIADLGAHTDGDDDGGVAP